MGFRGGFYSLLKFSVHILLKISMESLGLMCVAKHLSFNWKFNYRGFFISIDRAE